MNHQEIYEQICSPNFKRMEDKLDKILKCIEGNGTPGLKTRVDRLEQRSALQNKVIWALVACIIGTFADRLTDKVLPKNVDKGTLYSIEYYPTE